jgi:predicted secreted protein
MTISALKRLAGVLLLTMATMAFADNTPTPQPVITVTANATVSIPNDRMHAFLRTEVDNADAALAAAEVNRRIAQAIARAKAVAGVEVTTSGYSSYQVNEQNRPTRWRVAQTITLEGNDFAALAGLATRMQADDGLVLSGLNFSVSTKARRAAEEALTQQAIKAWQQRAQAVATGFGATAWRTGRVTVQASDDMRPQPMMRASAASAMAPPPVNVEGGNSDVTVTVSGEAILDSTRINR